MWFKFSQSLKKVDDVARQVKTMNPYDPDRHFALLMNETRIPDVLPDTIEGRMDILHNNAAQFREYLDIHPQIYIYPSETIGMWRYLIFDPKNFRRMDNPDYHEKLTTPFPIETPYYKVQEWIHRKYPTAMIDMFASEEEMLEQE